jgi:hypothetical protein
MSKSGDNVNVAVEGAVYSNIECEQIPSTPSGGDDVDVGVEGARAGEGGGHSGTRV